MQRFTVGGLTLALAALAGAATAPIAAQDTAEDTRAVTVALIDSWRTELSNAGRWGEQDQLGALNLITAAKRKAAAALVRDGVSISLAHDVLTEPAADNPNPFEHTMVATGGIDNTSAYAMDRFAVTYHGFAHTHLDALCHVWHDGRMYNGYTRATVTEEGCRQLAIDAVRHGVFTRGVLVDIPWVKEVEYLEPATPIYAADLDAFEAKSGIEIGPGDALLLRTGRWTRRAEKGAWGPAQGAAGLHASCAPWLKERDIALLGSDAGSDVVPSGIEGGAPLFLPIHELAIVTMGVPIIDNADLEELSAAARQRGRFEFLLTLAPLRVAGATGSPVNPIATF